MSGADFAPIMQVLRMATSSPSNNDLPVKTFSRAHRARPCAAGQALYAHPGVGTHSCRRELLRAMAGSTSSTCRIALVLTDVMAAVSRSPSQCRAILPLLREGQLRGSPSPRSSARRARRNCRR